VKTSTRRETRINREEVTRELLALLAEIDRREEVLAEHGKTERKRIAELRGQVKERRDILAGVRGVQLSIGHADRAAADVLAEAAAAEKCGACGKPAGAPSPGCDECDHGRTP
jgi:hypothetical protein